MLNSSNTEEGDGIRMALWAGAQLEAGGGCMIWNRGIMNDDTNFGEPYTGRIFLPGSQPFLHVNMNGERFMNEDQCYPMSYAAGANQPGHFLDRLGRHVLGGHPALRHAPAARAWRRHPREPR